MALLELLSSSFPLTLTGLQNLQREYDQRFVTDRFRGFDKVRHTYAHVGKLFGRLVEYVQATEDGGVPSSSDIVEKVIPDLLVYCFWLAESFGVDVEQAYL